MLVIQAFGLMIMLLSIIIFFFFEDSHALANTLLQIGLVCAIPAAIYLVVYALHKVLENREQPVAVDPYAQHHSTNSTTTINNTYIIQQEPDPVTEELTNLEQDAIVAIREENEQLERVVHEQAAQLVQIQEYEESKEGIKEIQEDLDDHKKKIEDELAAMRAELAKQQAEGDDALNKELQDKIDELTRALAAAALLEKEKADKAQQNKEKRALAAAEKKALLSKPNVEKHIEKYFVETAACFLMDRDAYKDRFGLSPYNRVIVTKHEDKHDEVKHVMMATGDKLYKFCEILIDASRFLEHKSLYPMFVELTKEGTSLVRISEKLHLMYLQFYKKDFVKDYRYKEDFENLLVLVSHKHIVKGYDFNQVFNAFPFNPASENFGEADIIEYLKNPELQKAFEEYFPNYADLGFETLHQALVVTFMNSIKDNLDVDTLVGFIVKDANKLATKLAKASAKKDAKKPATKKPATPKAGSTVNIDPATEAPSSIG